MTTSSEADGPSRLSEILYEAAAGPSRNHAAENSAMLELVHALTASPDAVAQYLADAARSLTGADSAGISLVDTEDGQEVFRWIATSGEYARYLNGTMPRHFSPCGDVLARGRPLLMRDMRRAYPYVEQMHVLPGNALLVPFADKGQLIGTVWVVNHDVARGFDAEDVRIVSSLSVFASAVNGTIGLVRDLKAREAQKEHQLRDSERELRDTRRLHAVAARLIGAEGNAAIYNDILNAAIDIVEADAGTIQLLDQQTQVLSLLATRGFSAETRSHFASVDASSGSPCGRALASGKREVMVFDHDAPDPDGSTKLHLAAGLTSAQSTPLLSRSGRPLGMFSTHWASRRSLTDRDRRFLDLLGRQAADLIERSQVQAALQEREQQSREDSRRKDEFIAVLAHELRNPLAPIRTGIDLLKTTEEPVVQRVRPMMERQVKHMVRLVDDLLDVSRITTGKVELRPEKVTVASLIESAVESQQVAIDAAKQRLVLDLPAQDLCVLVDPARMSQVISNIMHNAVKFTPAHGTITVQATVERTSAPGMPDTLCISIADTGPGIPSDMLGSIFDLFTQVRPQSEAPHGGLGIGLALSRSLVEMHGGSITAESPGRGLGSRFTVRIPAPTLEDDAELNPGERADVVPAGVRVLVIDDNPDAADSMGLMLEQLGCTVRVAHGGHDGLSALESFPAALVLLDIGMPGLDGYEVCRRVRAKHGSDVRVVALTGWGQDSDREAASAAGFDGHVTKPLGYDLLKQLVKSTSDGIGHT